jgi:hypothetical protein
MKKVFLLFIFTSFQFSFAQELHFTELGTKPANCRTADYQSADGVAYCAASSAAPGIKYLWQDLSNEGSTSTFSTWPGRKPGYYKINVTNAIGELLIDTVYVDSILPEAILGLSGDGLSGSMDEFQLLAGTEVLFYNANPFEPLNNWFGDSYFLFKPQEDSAFIEIPFDEFESFTHVYDSHAVKEQATLVYSNYHGCMDTAKAIINIVPSVENLVVNFVNDELCIQFPVSHDGYEFTLYNLSGQVIFAKSILDQQAIISASLPKAVYFYDIKEIETLEKRYAGKVVHQ